MAFSVFLYFCQNNRVIDFCRHYTITTVLTRLFYVLFCSKKMYSFSQFSPGSAKKKSYQISMPFRFIFRYCWKFYKYKIPSRILCQWDTMSWKFIFQIISKWKMFAAFERIPREAFLIEIFKLPWKLPSPSVHSSTKTKVLEESITWRSQCFTNWFGFFRTLHSYSKRIHLSIAKHVYNLESSAIRLCGNCQLTKCFVDISNLDFAAAIGGGKWSFTYLHVIYNYIWSVARMLYGISVLKCLYDIWMS